MITLQLSMLGLIPASLAVAFLLWFLWNLSREIHRH
jgi:hypothetical protein